MHNRSHRRKAQQVPVSDVHLGGEPGPYPKRTETCPTTPRKGSVVRCRLQKPQQPTPRRPRKRKPQGQSESEELAEDDAELATDETDGGEEATDEDEGQADEAVAEPNEPKAPAYVPQRPR
jgi:hypothetical protein